MTAAPSSPSMQSHRVLTNTDGEALHQRINGLIEKFADHDARNAGRFSGLEQQVRHIEKIQDQQGEKIASIATTVDKMDGKLDTALANNNKSSDTDTRWRRQEEAKADIWTDRAKKVGLALLAVAAVYFSGRGVIEQFTPREKENKKAEDSTNDK